MIWLGVAALSAAGAVGRYGIMAGLEGRLDRAFSSRTALPSGTPIPWGTAVVNLLAAFALGLVVDASDDWVRLLGIGFLGSFSTFSTWMVEGVFLAGSGSRRQLAITGLWLCGMLALGVTVFGLGRVLAR